MDRKLIFRLCASMLLTLVFLLASTVPSRAQHMNEPDSPCAGPSSTSELAGCLAKALAVSDAKLNAVYQSIRKKLGADGSKGLVETQRIWIKYRDANCAEERSFYEGGTAARPAYLACLEAMTRTRTKELQITYLMVLKD